MAGYSAPRCTPPTTEGTSGRRFRCPAKSPVWNPGWERGIRVADIKTGWVKAFIPDEEVTRGAGTEFLGVDLKGNIYSGASGRPGLVVHELFRPLY